MTAIHAGPPGPGDGCQKRYAFGDHEKAISVKMMEDYGENVSEYLVFYSSDNCEPDKEIKRTTDVRGSWAVVY